MMNRLVSGLLMALAAVAFVAAGPIGCASSQSKSESSVSPAAQAQPASNESDPAKKSDCGGGDCCDDAEKGVEAKAEPAQEAPVAAAEEAQVACNCNGPADTCECAEGGCGCSHAAK